MSWNTFGNSSMTGEGGFMNNTTTGQSADNEDKGKKRGETCVPLMITHIVRHGEKLKVWGNPVRLITLVSIVRKIEITSTKVTFDLMDETGSISGILWLLNNSAKYKCPVEVKKYARVHGIIKDEGDDRYIKILNIQPIASFMEKLSHLMEVTHMCLKGEKDANEAAKNDMVNKSTQNGLGNNGHTNSGLNRQQQMVLEIIENNNKTEFGIERNQIKSSMASNIPPETVDEILDFLSSEGHIYTTTTENYFKTV